VQDKNLHVFGRAALLRRPRIQGRAAALPYLEDEDFRPAPGQDCGVTRGLILERLRQSLRVEDLVSNANDR
jgi:hypothetical protein